MTTTTQEPTKRPSSPLPDWVFSNFKPCILVVDGIEFPTLEHAFQATKTLDLEEKLRIASAPTPGKAKRLGREITIRPDWEEIKVDVMRDLIRQKFAVGSGWAKLLLRTETDKIFEVTNWHDTFWGICICDTHKGTGKNTLGQLLMERRKELR